MVTKYFTLLYCLITFTSQITNAKTNNLRVKRVAGGKVQNGEVPWMAGIFSKTREGEWRNCSGTLINEQFVLTSAKCVDKVKSTVMILGGVAISDRRTDPKSYFAKTRGRHVIHPEKGRFGQTPIYNFALIRLQKPIDFSKYPHIKPACLPSLEGSYAGKSGVTGGYGETVVKRYSSYNGGLRKGESSTVSDTLKSLKMEVMGNSVCSSLYTRVSSSFAVAPETLCALSEEGDLCGDGDKGAGLVIPGSGNTASELIGVSFYGIGCNSSVSGQKLPHVFGRITPSVTSWIKNTVSKYGSNICSTNTPQNPSCSTLSPPTPPKLSSYCSGSCGRSKKRLSCDDRILGGTEACEHEFPWAALLEIDGASRCGGNLINDRYILTAGHCFDKSDPNNVRITVTLGEHDTEERDGEYKVTVTSFKLHPRLKKTSNSLEYDLALIEIPPVDLRQYRNSIGPVCLPAKVGTPVNYRGRATAYGWGKEEKLFENIVRHNGVTISKGTATNLSTKLQKLDFNFVPQCECVSDFDRVGIPLGSSHLCAVSERGDTCAGDSGGGLVRAVGDRYELVGVVSFGVGCDSRINGKKLSGVYARVTEALDWITDTIGDGQCYA